MKDGKYLTLGIESSCDETSAAVLANGREILSNVIASQIQVHKIYGGVVPEIASRHHLDAIPGVFAQALEEAGVSLSQIDEVGVCAGPGLAGALIIGTSFAKAVCAAADKPLVGVHHIQAHIMANLIENPELEPPFLALVVSGGHSHIVEALGYNSFRILGRTRDDAVGEAYDKVARVLGLGYPGGPGIDALAKEGDPFAVEFKRVYLEEGSLDFSFSGTKTGVVNYLHREKQAGRDVNAADVAASFQEAVMEVIVSKVMKALEITGYKEIAVAGGVAGNSCLRKKFENACEEKGVKLYIPSPVLCTDNGAMVAAAAYRKARAGILSSLRLDVWPGLSMEEDLKKLEGRPEETALSD